MGLLLEVTDEFIRLLDPLYGGGVDLSVWNLSDREVYGMTRRFSLSRNQLKWLALFCMVLDHAACAFLPETSTLYLVFRFVFGRMAYPMFCVLFVEGFLYTRHPGRHIRDLLLFGILSEPFF